MSQSAPCDALCPKHQCLRFGGGGFLSHTNKLDAGGALSRGRCSICTLQLHRLHHRPPHSYMAMSLPTLQLHRLHRSMPRSWTHHIATPIAATQAMLLCTLQLHGPYCHPLVAAWPCCCLPYSWTHHVAAPIAAAHAAHLVVGCTMSQHASWLDAPHCNPHCSCTCHITVHQAAAWATSPSPL